MLRERTLRREGQFEVDLMTALERHSVYYGHLADDRWSSVRLEQDITWFLKDNRSGKTRSLPVVRRLQALLRLEKHSM